MTDKELMQQALDALENTTPTGFNMESDKRFYAAITALRERLAQPEFPMHEEGEDGWSNFVCPDPKSYLMKCCDCGLVHEAQFKVVSYKSETEREDCEPVDDPNLQAVFRMRRSEQWTPKDTAYRPGGLTQPEQEPVAWMDKEVGAAYLASELNANDDCAGLQPLYTAPPQRKPLTDEEIQKAVTKAVRERKLSWLGFRKDEQGEYTIPSLSPSDYQMARAIEAAHGIKEEA